MEIAGKITEIFDEQQITDTFKKREFVIEYVENPQYPEYLVFQAIQDKTSMLDEFNVGDDVVVSFNLKGRKWTSPKGEVKYFNTLQAWRLSRKSMSQGDEGGSQGAAPSNDVPPPSSQDAPGDFDDLPF